MSTVSFMKNKSYLYIIYTVILASLFTHSTTLEVFLRLIDVTRVAADILSIYYYY